MAMAMRPRFSIELACASRDAIERLCGRLATAPVVVKRTRVPGGGRESGPRDEEHLVLTIPPEHQHFWSPWLTVEVSPRDAGTQLHARFSPHPSVWTGFAFAYLALGLVGAVALVIAGSGALLPDSDQSWAWWAAGGAVVVMIGLWWASQVGQRLARAQMELLRGALEQAIDACREQATAP